MNPVKEHPDFLQNIESTIVQVWKTQPEMTNYAVMRAYDSAIAFYGAIAREHIPKAVILTGLDANLFEVIKKICEWRLGRSAGPVDLVLPPLTAEDMVACLRKLRKSVDYWTQQGGRQGYMQFIEKFVG